MTARETNRQRAERERAEQAQQVWIDYNALGLNGEHSMARAEYAKAKIANGTAPLTPEAVDLMAAEVAKRVERREALEKEAQEAAERRLAAAAPEPVRKPLTFNDEPWVGDRPSELITAVTDQVIREALEQKAERHAQITAGYKALMGTATTPGEIELRLGIMGQIAALLGTYYAPFTVEKGPALLVLTGDDIPSPARLLEVINGYITGEGS